MYASALIDNLELKLYLVKLNIDITVRVECCKNYTAGSQVFEAKGLFFHSTLQTFLCVNPQLIFRDLQSCFIFALYRLLVTEAQLKSIRGY